MTPPTSFYRHILDESEAMTQYAMAQGLTVPPDVVAGVVSARRDLDQASPDQPRTGGDDARRLAGFHQQLARLVAPATPRTLLLLGRSGRSGSLVSMFGPVPLVRRFMVVALMFLGALLLISAAPDVNPDSIARGFFENSGVSQLYCQSFLLCAAGLGACFSGLFEANRYVGRGVYDPKYDASYWSRLVLGLMAGVMLAELVGPSFLEDSAKSTPSELAFAKPTLAMLGGFSAALVHRILDRLIHSVASFVSVTGDAALRAQEDSLRTRLQADAVQQKLTLAGRLSSLRASLPEDARADDALGRLVEDLLSPSGVTVSTPRMALGVGDSANTAQASEPRPTTRPSDPPSETTTSPSPSGSSSPAKTGT